MTWLYQAALAKASLILLSAISFAVNCRPPNGLPPSLPPRPPLKRILSSEMREWTLMLIPMYIYPTEVKLYCLASLNEARYILRTDTASDISPLFLLAAVLSLLGGMLRYLSYQALAESFRFELVHVGAHSKDTKGKSAKLVTHGPYSTVRHPSYTGMAFASVGCAMMHLVENSWIRSNDSPMQSLLWVLVGLWVLVMVVVNVLLFIRMGEEDEMMHKQFGEEWERWRRRVKYMLIPMIY